MSEQLTLETPEAIRFPLQGIPIAEMLAQINREGLYICRGNSD